MFEQIEQEEKQNKFFELLSTKSNEKTVGQNSGIFTPKGGDQDSESAGGNGGMKYGEKINS